MLHPMLVGQLQSAMPEGDVPAAPRREWFASAGAVSTQHYCSPANDAWCFSWSGWLSWIFPPFWQLGLVCEKLVRDGCAATVIVPAEPQAGWFQQLARAADLRFDIAPHSSNLIPLNERAAATGRHVRKEPLVAFVSRSFVRAHEPLTECRRIPLSLPVDVGVFARARTPLVHDAWATRLRAHPDQALVARVLAGILHGRSLNYAGARLEPRVVSNLPSERKYAAELARARAKERERGWVCGPFDDRTTPPLFNLVVSPSGGVFHRFKNKVRPIGDYSFPHLANGEPGPQSVNGQTAAVTVSYSSIDELCSALVRCGPGALLFGFDVVSAYRLIPVKMEDWHLQGACGEDGRFFFSTALQFGLRRAVELWDEYGGCFGDMLASDAGVRASIDALLRYVDDFLTITFPLASGQPDDRRAESCRDNVLQVAAELGVPLDKFKGPATRVEFLGVVVDAARMTLEFTAERRAFMLSELRQWERRKCCRRRELQSLAGVLSFACRVLRPGRAFLQSCFRLLHVADTDRGHVRMSGAFRRDIQWWTAAIATWPGTCIIRDTAVRTPSTAVDALHVWTDASERGQGALFGDNWFSLAWTPWQLERARRAHRVAMPFLELWAVLSACCAFGERWRGRVVVVHTDCEPAQAAITKHHSDAPESQALVRAVAMCEIQNDFSLCAVHIEGVRNVCADALSRLDMAQFKLACPSAAPSPTPVPQPHFLAFD